MEKIGKLKALLETAEKDGSLFFNKGNNAAGTRFRNTLQQIKALSTELRKDVMDQKKVAK